MNLARHYRSLCGIDAEVSVPMKGTMLMHYLFALTSTLPNGVSPFCKSSPIGSCNKLMMGVAYYRCGDSRQLSDSGGKSPREDLVLILQQARLRYSCPQRIGRLKVRFLPRSPPPYVFSSASLQRSFSWSNSWYVVVPQLRHLQPLPSSDSTTLSARTVLASLSCCFIHDEQLSNRRGHF